MQAPEEVKKIIDESADLIRNTHNKLSEKKLFLINLIQAINVKIEGIKAEPLGITMQTTKLEKIKNLNGVKKNAESLMEFINKNQELPENKSTTLMVALVKSYEEAKKTLKQLEQDKLDHLLYLDEAELKKEFKLFKDKLKPEMPFLIQFSEKLEKIINSVSDESKRHTVNIRAKVSYTIKLIKDDEDLNGRKAIENRFLIFVSTEKQIAAWKEMDATPPKVPLAASSQFGHFSTKRSAPDTETQASRPSEEKKIKAEVKEEITNKGSKEEEEKFFEINGPGK